MLYLDLYTLALCISASNWVSLMGHMLNSFTTVRSSYDEFFKG